MPALDPVTNFGIVTVNTTYDASATTIVLSSGHGARLPLPSATVNGFNVTWWNATDYSAPEDDPNVEIVRVTARSTDTLTVTRAQEGTSASTKNTAAKTYKMVLSPTKKLRDDIELFLMGMPEGTMWNGKIVPTVVSNDLVLTVKTWAGNDPSASDPMAIRLGGTVYFATAAITITKADGTNWLQLGSAVLGGLEHDLFAYIYYDTAASTLRVAASRMSHGKLIGDFNVNQDNDHGLLIVAGGTLTATDICAVVGRFAATLSLSGTSHLWTVPTYTAKNLIQHPFYETRMLDFTIVPTGNMTVASLVQNYAKYKITPNRCIEFFNFTVTTSAGPGNEIRHDYPMTPDDGTVSYQWGTACNDSTNVAGFSFFESSKVVSRRYDSSNWGTGAGRGPAGVIQFGI